MSLNFLIAGHTKKEHDEAFGGVKRKMKNCNTLCPKQMRHIIYESHVSAKTIAASYAQLYNWKICGAAVPVSFQFPS